MPTNLPPESKAKWARAQDARDPKEKMELLQEFLSTVPKHKHTERLRAQTKHKIAVLKREIQEQKIRKAARKGGRSFFIEKEGAAQIVLLGLTGSGKSRLLGALTNADVEVAHYSFTTKYPIPGMLTFEDIQLQLIEAPALMEGASRGVAWGQQVLALARNADALAMIIDLSRDAVRQYRIIMEELEAVKIFLERPKGTIQIERRYAGAGLTLILAGRLLDSSPDEVKQLLKEYHLENGMVKITGSVTLDDIEDAIFESSTYKPALILATKAETSGSSMELEDLKEVVGARLPTLRVSAAKGIGLNEIGSALFKILDVIRVYTKEPNDARPAIRPVILRSGSTVLDVAKTIHSQFYRNFKYARIWGPSAKYPAEHVGITHVLLDGDAVEIRIK